MRRDQAHELYELEKGWDSKLEGERMDTGKYRKYVATQPAKTPAKRPVAFVEATEREKAGTAQGEVSHVLRKSLGKRFDMAPILGSPALCTWDGSRWQCVVYAEVGDRRFSLSAEDFGLFFQEVEA